MNNVSIYITNNEQYLNKNKTIYVFDIKCTI